MVRTWGADDADDRFVFTDAYSDYAGAGDHATNIRDRNGGADTVNAAAVGSASRIRLDGAVGSIDGVAVRLAGIEHAIGGDGNDRLIGDAGDNRLHGMRGRDSLSGGEGTDALHGLTGSDLLIGGPGRDLLFGGTGNDRFRFRSVDDSPFGADGQDVIDSVAGPAFANPGARRGDRIILRTVDANDEVAGDQTFAFDDSGAIGTLRCIDAGAVTRVLGFTDGDAAADFCIDIVDGGTVAASYGAADFAL